MKSDVQSLVEMEDSARFVLDEKLCEENVLLPSSIIIKMVSAHELCLRQIEAPGRGP